MELDSLSLSDTIRLRPHYLVSIYQAMRAYLESDTRTPIKGSPAHMQCVEIMEKAEREYRP